MNKQKDIRLVLDWIVSQELRSNYFDYCEVQSRKNKLYDNIKINKTAYTKKMKIIYIICAILALVASFNMPIGYYTFLRISLTLGALVVLYNEVQREASLLGISFIAIAILFNPILPIYLYQKTFWIPIDIATAILFITYWLKQQLKNK